MAILRQKRFAPVTRRFLIVAGFADSLVAFRGELLEALAECGFDVHAAAPQLTRHTATHDRLEAMGVTLHDIPTDRVGTNPVADLRLLIHLYRLMRALRPDGMLGYTIKSVIYGISAAWLARVSRRFALVTGLGYAFTESRGGWLQWLIRRLYAFALKRASKVFFQNPDDAALFRQLGIVPSIVPSVVVNGSGVDLHRFAPSDVPPNGICFLMICRLLGDKGVREYAQAAKRIHATNPEVRFALAGWIDENPDSIAQTELDAWTAAGTIDFLGKLDDVRPVLAGCTVYVLPSYREGTPRTVLEAMSAGRPIITTDAPGCRETVVNGCNGFLVAVKSVDALVGAMRKFIDDPSLASRMGRESRKIAESKYDVHEVNKVMLREMGILESRRAEDACHE